MSVDGTWKLVMQTPIGERKSTLTLKQAGPGLTGRLAGEEGNATDIYDGQASDAGLGFKAAIKNPMPLTLEFTGKVSGDSISGDMGLGFMGSFPFTGSRG